MDKELREEVRHAFAKSPFITIRLDAAGGHAEPMTAQLAPGILGSLKMLTASAIRSRQTGQHAVGRV